MIEEDKDFVDEMQELDLNRSTLNLLIYNPTSTGIELSVSDPITVRGKIRKHTEYQIKVRLQGGAFEVSRRYKDFLALQGVIQKSWPGCNVPQIPPKKTFGNMTSVFIEKRRKLLEVFLLKLSATSYILEGEPLQLFLKNEGKFRKLLPKQEPSYQQVASAYQSTFPELVDYDLNDDEIDKGKDLFQETLENLKTAKKQIRRSKGIYYQFGQHYNRLMKNMGIVSENYTGKFVDYPIREKFINPFNVLYDWITAEELEIKAVLAAIADKESLDLAHRKLDKSLGEKRNELNRLKDGKKSVSQLFANKSIEELVHKTNEKIDQLQGDISSLNFIRKIVVAKLIMQDMPTLKQKNGYKIDQIFKVFSEASVQEYQVYQRHMSVIPPNN